MLSRAGATLLASAVLCCGVVYYVHRQQEVERERMHAAVLRDEERQRLKSLANEQLNR